MKVARKSGFLVDNRDDRRRVVDEAIANQHLAGLELHPDDAAEFDRFVDGEITLEELREIVMKRYSRKK